MKTWKLNTIVFIFLVNEIKGFSNVRRIERQAPQTDIGGGFPPTQRSTADGGVSTNNPLTASTPSTDGGGSNISSGNGSNPSPINNLGPNGAIQQLGCGSRAIMQVGNVYQVSSPNFGQANYDNNEVCTWKFRGDECTLAAMCPCVDIPPSWNCLFDYVKIRTGLFHDLQKFCGGNTPSLPIVSDSGQLSIRFRSDFKITAKGFTCFVSCVGPGFTQPILPLNSTTSCPTF